MLSRKKAMLAAYLIDAQLDRLFAAEGEPAGDILAFRSAFCAQHPAVALVADLVAGPAELVIDAVEVPASEYDQLSVEDFMVSLYNRYTVQRVRLVTPDGNRVGIHEILARAVADLAP